MKNRRKDYRQSIENWLEYALTEESELLFRDVHFDMLDDPISRLKPGLPLIEGACDLLSRIQTLAEARKERTQSWTVLISCILDWERKTFPLWNEKFWKSFGLAMEPPSVFLLRSDLQHLAVVERYTRQVKLPFDGYPEIKALYDVSRNAEDIAEGDFTPRIYMWHHPLINRTFLERNLGLRL